MPDQRIRDGKVIDSPVEKLNIRRRQCLSALIYTTYEISAPSPCHKRDRSTEPFDRRKLVNSLAKGLRETFDKSRSSFSNGRVDDIIHEIETGGREVTSAQVGTHVIWRSCAT